MTIDMANKTIALSLPFKLTFKATNSVAFFSLEK